MKGQDRLHHGVEHEQRVASELKLRGWHVQPWGQGLFTDQVRQSLNACDPVVFWRWLPDLIAVRDGRVVMVDPKTDLTSTDNFSIEMAAWHAHQLMRPLGLRTVYVFSDLTCNTPEGLRIERVFNGQRAGGRVNVAGGSGTPYMLVKRSEQWPLDKWFGAPLWDNE